MTGWTTGICEANGAAIHYLRTGGAKRPLVLLHGLTGSGACWTLLARALEGRHDVVMPDARGHGRSSKPSNGYRYEDHANDVVGLIQGLELADPILLGHSMGGMTAAVVAAQAGIPIRGLVLADPTFLSTRRQREVHESEVVEQHRQLLCLGPEAALAQARIRHAHRKPEVVELAISARLQTGIAAFDVLMPPNPDYRQLINVIDVPILLVIADHGVVSNDTAVELQKLNPRLRVEQIQGAGHALHHDQPERFAAVVESFLRSVPASSPLPAPASP